MFEARTRLAAGLHVVGAALLNPSDPKDQPNPAKTGRRLVVKFVEIDGPYNAVAPPLPDHHQRFVAPAPDLSDREAARDVLARFAARAFRRPLRAGEVEPFVGLYDRAEKEGLRWEERLRLALTGVLVSPRFLFRVEADPRSARRNCSSPRCCGRTGVSSISSTAGTRSSTSGWRSTTASRG